MIILIAAISKNNVIGFQGQLPWGRSQQADLQRFKARTTGKTIIVGAATFAGGDFPLPERKHIVIANRVNSGSENVTYMEAAGALEFAQKQSRQEDVYVIGGQAVYGIFIDYADALDLTFVDADYQGDRFFPKIDKAKWKIKSRNCHQADKANLHDYCFVSYEKR